MKKAFYLFALVMFLNFSQSYAESSLNLSQNEKTGYVITIKSEDIDDVYIYLSRRVSGAWENIDSALFMGGKDVNFKGNLNSPEVLYLRAENTGKPVSFFAENSEITVLPDFIKPENTKVEGSSVHDEFELYESMFTELKALQDEAYKEYTSARKNKDEAKMEEVGRKFDEYAAKEMEMNKKYIAQNDDSYVSPYIIRSKMFYTLKLDELKTLVGQLDNSISNSVYVSQLNEHITILEKVAIGKKFTDFTLPNPEGVNVSLSDVTGQNYVLIDFWASWCGPCRRENPNVVRLYKDFHEKGFDIIGVSFDNSEENWLKAIKDDELSWHHVSDLKGWGSKAGKLYGVNSIPATVLLDPDGTIIAKNLRSEELREKLDEFLK